MFNNLFNLGYKRSTSQAFGFYIVYVLIGLLLAGLIGLIAAIIYPDVNGLMLGGIIGASYTLFVYFYSYYLKKLNSIYLIFLGLAVGVLAYLIGIIISFIVVAYLTTKGDSNIEEPINSIDSTKSDDNINGDEPNNIIDTDDSSDNTFDEK